MAKENSGINWWIILGILILLVKIFGFGILVIIFLLLFANAIDPW